MHLSTAYYPEHWPRERWKEDIRLMSEAGISLVRIAEFAWSRMERKPGKFDFSWLDELAGLLAKHQMKMILCTPTAAPPVWLVAKHPDILFVHANGIKRPFGGRRHYCPNNLHFCQHTVEIVRAMARHFHSSPVVLGWQIDNEFAQEGTVGCHCEVCKQKFQKWLKKKYKSLGNLNQTWGTVFWSQEYSDWNQIDLPVNVYDGTMELQPWFRNNPSHLLDAQRFFSESYLEYQRLQIKALRQEKVFVPITTNLATHDIDHYRMAKELDIAGGDSYLEAFTLDSHIQCFSLDYFRGLKGDSFWLLETTSGSTGVCWQKRLGPKPTPGTLRLVAYQAFAHGADVVNYFHWRSFCFGAEQYEQGLLDHDGIPRGRYQEIKQIGQEWKKIRNELSRTKISNETAIIFSFDNYWASRISPINSSQFDYFSHLRQYYDILRGMHIGVDIIPPTRKLSGYRLVIIPFCYLVNDGIVRRLEEYVSSGGTLLVTIKSGVKDYNNVITDEILPGKLSQLLGVEVELFEGLPNEEKNLISFTSGGKQTEPMIWRDVLKPVTARAVARYTSGYCRGKAVVTCNDYGKGRAYYMGTITDDDFTRGLLEVVLKDSKIRPLLDSRKKDVETVRRGEYIFVLNHSPKTRTIRLSRQHRDLLTGRKLQGQVRLKAKEVFILR